jgi:hypothetical protein
VSLVVHAVNLPDYRTWGKQAAPSSTKPKDILL